MATFRKRAQKSGAQVWEVRVARKGYRHQYETFDARSEAEIWARQIEG